MQGDPLGNFTTRTPLIQCRLRRRVGDNLYLWCSHNAKIYWEGKYLRVPI